MGLFDAIGGLFGGDDVDEIRPNPIPVPNPNEMLNRQLQVNRVNQITPFGNVQFEGPDKNTLRFQLSPELQRLYQQQAGFGSQSLQQGMGLLSAIPGTGDEAVNAQLQRLQPGFDLQERRLRERLEQSGNPGAFGAMQMAPGSFNELALMNQGQNDARLAAVLQGPAYQGQFINNALALGQGSPIGVPSFNFQGATPADVLGPYGLQQQAHIANQGNAFSTGQFNANARNQGRSDMFGGLFDIGSAVLGGIF